MILVLNDRFPFRVAKAEVVGVVDNEDVEAKDQKEAAGLEMTMLSRHGLVPSLDRPPAQAF